MRSSIHIFRHLAGIGLATVGCLVVAACSGDTNPIRDAAVAVGAGPTSAETPDFVRQSRPTNLDYVPVGTSTPPRPTVARTAAEVKATEAELDAIRARNEAAARTAVEAGGTPPPEPARVSPAPGAGPATPTRRRPPASR